MGRCTISLFDLTDGQVGISIKVISDEPETGRRSNAEIAGEAMAKELEAMLEDPAFALQPLKEA
jgi:hypothetical protein